MRFGWLYCVDCAAPGYLPPQPNHHHQPKNLKTKGAEFFVKLAMGGRDDSMFRGEALGLTAMGGSRGVGG